MSNSSAAPREFWTLLSGAVDGTLSDAETDRLEHYLDGDFGLQMLFRNYCQLHINLESDTRAQRVVDHLNNGESSVPITMRRIERSEAPKRLHPSATAGLPRRRLLTPTRVGMVASVAVLACVVVALAVKHWSPETAQAAIAFLRASQSKDQDLDIIAVRLTSDESRFLSIGDVGNIHVQGPAHLELFGTSRAVLYEGRIKVRITDARGHGFVVETPQGRVTDLGTEFGVDVAKDTNTGVVVFEGAVNLAVPGGPDNSVHVQRLVQGEGLSANDGRVDRIMSIVTGGVSTFSQRGEARPRGLQSSIIVDVFDNIRTPDLRKFYEIVPGGLKEDALAYVDRPAHDWSGVDARGIPPYLLGADYVKPFNSDKMRSDVKIFVKVAVPAKLFVFADDRVTPPKWLRDNFRDTGDDIGHDIGNFELNGEIFHRLNRGKGPGKSIDSRCSIWERIVARPGTIELGPNAGSSDRTAMYGIAAIRLNADASATLPASAGIKTAVPVRLPAPSTVSMAGENR